MSADGDWRRFLRWDRVEDASILHYEFTVDEGRTWSFLEGVPSAV